MRGARDGLMLARTEIERLSLRAPRKKVGSKERRAQIKGFFCSTRDRGGVMVLSRKGEASLGGEGAVKREHDQRSLEERRQTLEKDRGKGGNYVSRRGGLHGHSSRSMRSSRLSLKKTIVAETSHSWRRESYAKDAHRERKEGPIRKV